MAEIILHHYDRSPFSEKVRLVCGLKGVTWRSVDIPRWMPKPELMPLTGGYRKTPVMQIGADAVGVVFGTFADQFPSELKDDRRKFTNGLFDADRMKARQPAIRAQFRAHAQWIEGALADGRAHVLGAAPGIADFGLYHVLWFVCGNIKEVDLLAGCDATKAWLERMAKLGHGTRTPLDAKEALAIARAARPDSVERRGGGDMSGRRPGERVTVAANDYGRDPVAGELLAIDDRAIVIRRVDPEAGDLNLHFPRAGFDVAAAP